MSLWIGAIGSHSPAKPRRGGLNGTASGRGIAAGPRPAAEDGQMRVEVLLLAGYLGTIALLSAYSWHRYHLTRLYRKHRPAAARVAPLVVHPRVTVQLPVYNAMYVMEPLLQAVCRLDYPRALL